MEAQTQTTVLFAEVSGSKELLQAAGKVSGARAISECIERIRRSAESAGGKLVRVMGSEIMLLFDTPERAAGAASKMHATIDALPPVAGTKLAVQVGFHTGPVYTSGDDVLGDTVKLAAALVHQAQRGQTITSQKTAELLGNTFRSHPKQLVAVPLAPAHVDACGLAASQPRPGASIPRALGMLNLRYGNEVVLCWRENERVIVGRDRGCSLVIDATFASRKHCTIRLTPEGFVVRDHSSNGTYVTNQGAEEILLRNEEAPLATHGWISFGRSRLLSTQQLQFFGR
jgi:adenylate cyclase